MKKILLSVIVVVAITLSSSAQTDQGSFLLTGTLGVSSSSYYPSQSSTNKRHTTDVSIIPKFGYFVADNLALGLGIGYYGSTEKQDGNSGKTVNSAVIVNPFGRYYVGVNEKFKFFGELGVGLGFGKNKEDNGTSSTTTNSRDINVYLSPGFAYFPSDRVSFELSITGISFDNYDSNTDSDSENDTETTFNLGNSTPSSYNSGFFNPKLGISFYF